MSRGDKRGGNRGRSKSRGGRSGRAVKGDVVRGTKRKR